MDIVHLIAESIGFDWDEGNINKNWMKHRVSPPEAEEVFFNKPLLLLPDPKHSMKEQRYIAMGKTDKQRLLFVIWMARAKVIRVISARAMNEKERRMYEQEA